MSEMRAEAISLIDEIPDDKLGKFIDVLKNFLRNEDPFWSEENQKYLRESIRELDEGRGQEHDLIET